MFFVVFITEPNNLSPTSETTVTTLTTKATSITTTRSPPPSTIPQPPTKVQGVAITRAVKGSSPALRVSWSAVSGSGITYTVCYSTTRGTHVQSDPPSGANCGASGITSTTTILGPLSLGTTYYIWVAAVSSNGRGPYSDREQARTHNGKLQWIATCICTLYQVPIVLRCTTHWGRMVYYSSMYKKHHVNASSRYVFSSSSSINSNI